MSNDTAAPRPTHDATCSSQMTAPDGTRAPCDCPPTPPHPTAPARGEPTGHCDRCGHTADEHTGGWCPKPVPQPTPTGAGEMELAPVDVDMACRIAADVAADGRLRLDRQRLAGLLRDAADALTTAREEAARLGRERVKLWECPDCAFAFDAMHEDEGGGYSCPLCAEQRLGRENDDLHAKLVKALADLHATESTLTARDAELAGVRAVVDAARRVADRFAGPFETAAFRPHHRRDFPTCLYCRQRGEHEDYSLQRAKERHDAALALRDSLDNLDAARSGAGKEG